MAVSLNENCCIMKNDKLPAVGISVIVITLNEEHNIRDCLTHLTNQRFPGELYEIIIIDASTDATPLIAAEFEDVRVLKSKKGFSRQKNAGWQAARFDVVAFTDADCLVPDDWLLTISAAMDHPGTVAVGGNALAPKQCRWFALCVACVGHPAGGAIGFDANISPGPRGISFIAGCNGAFRKSVIAEVGGFDSRFQDGGEDVDLSWRLRRVGYRLDYIPSLTLYHKPHVPFWHYVKWNIGVGVTKYSLRQPSLGKIIFDFRFPLWPLIALLLWFKWLLSAAFSAMAALALFWLLYLLFLSCLSRPFQLLLERRQKIGLDLYSTMTMVPLLVLVRQMAIAMGQLKKWLKVQRGRGN